MTFSVHNMDLEFELGGNFERLLKQQCIVHIVLPINITWNAE